MLEDQRGGHDEVEAAAARRMDTHRCTFLVEAPLEQDESVLEVVAIFRQLQRRVEFRLSVGERGPPGRGMVSNELPEQTTGQAFDHVLVVEERASVDELMELATVLTRPVFAIA